MALAQWRIAIAQLEALKILFTVSLFQPHLSRTSPETAALLWVMLGQGIGMESREALSQVFSVTLRLAPSCVEKEAAQGERAEGVGLKKHEHLASQRVQLTTGADGW